MAWGESLFPDQGLNLCPLQWKHWVFITGPPGKSPPFFNQMHVLVSQLKDVANKRKKTTKPLESERFNLEPSVQFSSVTQSYLTLFDPMDCSMPGLPVLHQLPEPAQTHVHWVSDAIQPSHPLSSPSPPAFNLSQHQGLFQWISSSKQVAKVLEFQLQHQSFQWIFRTDFL